MISFCKKLYYKYIKKTKLITVQLRGRLSESDNEFLKTTGKKYLLNKSQIVKKIVLAKNPIFFEVGFGNGSHIVGLAQANKDTLVVGSEMYMAGVVNTLRSSTKQRLNNLFVTSSDARDVLKKIPEQRLDRVYTLFPDPWPKARHNKRRLVKADFVELILNKLKQGGQCTIATDWDDYATEIQEVVERLKVSGTVYEASLTEQEKQNIFKTTFALRAKKDGREISLFVLQKMK